MRAVVQRVSRASVSVDDQTVGAIDEGLLVLLGIGEEDVEKDIDYLARKIAGLRVFPDEQGSMNRSIVDIAGRALVISQFTLFGDVRRGMRPSFSKAMLPEKAEPLYGWFIAKLKQLGIETAEGRFGAMMDVHLVNDGPVTILLDSTKLF